MSWDGAITALEAILVAAGTATSSAAFTLQAGEPGVPPKKMIAWWYDGAGDNPLISETFTDHPFGENVTIRGYWPVSNRATAPSRTLETEARNLARNIIAGLEGDRSLNEQCAAVVINDSTAGWLSIDGAFWRVITVPIVLGFTDVEPIAR
jgi:hypothetical protein